MIKPQNPPKHHLKISNIGPWCWDYHINYFIKQQEIVNKYIHIVHEGTRERDGPNNQKLNSGMTKRSVGEIKMRWKAYKQ